MQKLSSASEHGRALFTAAWAWREKLQRSMDGCHTTDDMSAISLSQYEEFDGPNVPLPSGYQVHRPALCGSACMYMAQYWSSGLFCAKFVLAIDSASDALLVACSFKLV